MLKILFTSWIWSKNEVDSPYRHGVLAERLIARLAYKSCVSAQVPWLGGDIQIALPRPPVHRITPVPTAWLAAFCHGLGFVAATKVGV